MLLPRVDLDRRRPTGTWGRAATAATVVAVLVASSLVPAVGAAEAGDPGPDPVVEGPLQIAPIEPVAKGVDGLAAPATDGATGLEARVVEVLAAAGDTSAVVEVVEANDGSVQGQVPGHLVLAALPSGSLDAVVAHPSVTGIRPPLAAEPLADDLALQVTGASASEQVGKTGVGAWTAMGFRGQGQKIGIIDAFDGDVWSAARAAGAVPPPTATFCRVDGLSCSVMSGRSAHGVAVAEIIHDQAPDAALFLVTVRSASDYQAAVAWLLARGVTVVNHSQTAPYDGPGDGTGVFASVVDTAVDGGMTWVQAAGNAAGSPGANGDHWRGPFTDVDGDGVHEFGPGDEVLNLDCGFLNGVRWDDFGEPDPTDLDVYLVSLPDLGIISRSERTHGDGQTIEWPEPRCSPGQRIGLVVQRFAPGASEATPDTIEVMGNGVWLERWTNPSSASGPFADVATAGALTVGAVDPALGTAAAPYSSWGPTTDGRRKPDLVAASCVASYAASQVLAPCFNGTSAAAPAVAGAAAAVRSSGLATTPADLAALLRGATVDRGPAGPDQIYGDGELVLGSPPVTGTRNDDLADARPTGLGTQHSLTSSATVEGPEPSHAGVPDSHSVWWRVTAPWTGTMTVRTAGSDHDTVLAAYAGAAYPLAPIAADDDGGADGSAEVGFPVVLGRTYRIAVAGKGTASGSVALEVAMSGSCPPRFVDVPATGAFCPAIAWSASTGVTDGTGPVTFGPTRPVSRQVMVAFLHRMAGSPDPPPGAPTFVDVGPDDLFADAIGWAAATGITGGYPDGTFRPALAVSRQSMAAFLHRRDGSPPPPPDPPAFRDVPGTNPFAADIAWLTGTGTAQGYADGSFGPTRPVSRQAMSSFLWLGADAPADS